MNGRRLRPVMDEYLQSNNADNQNNNSNYSNTNPPSMNRFSNQEKPNNLSQKNTEPPKTRFFNPNQTSSQPLANESTSNNLSNYSQSHYENNRIQSPTDIGKQQSSGYVPPANTNNLNRGSLHEIYGEPHLHRTSQSHSIIKY